MQILEQPPDVLCLSYNQDQTCLAVGTRMGFGVFSTDSFALLHKEACGPVFLVEMLFRTSLLALVGRPVATRALAAPPCRQLSMWNTKERCSICQLQFNGKIHGVRMNHRRLVVLLDLKVHIFDLKTMKCLHVIDRTPLADPSLAWLCAASERGYLAMPLSLAGAGLWHGASSGSPEVAQGDCGQAEAGEARLGLVTIVDTYTLKSVGTVLAHRSPVQALCVNPTGQLLATASAKGTVIRVFSVPSLDTLYAFRRGTSTCCIFGLLFSRNSLYLCASASSGTVHVFRNPGHKLSALHLESEEATVGAAQRELVMQASPRSSGEEPLQASSPPSPLNAEELAEWTVVAERPESELEQNIVDRQSLPLQALSVVSEMAVGSTAKYAKSLFKNLLPQPCRDLVDSQRAFAWVHLREEEPWEGTRSAEGLLSRAPGRVDGHGAHGRYIACISAASRSGWGHAEVIVATGRGSVHVYNWSTATGGECRLRTEHSLSGQWVQPLREDEGRQRLREEETQKAPAEDRPTPVIAA